MSCPVELGGQKALKAQPKIDVAHTAIRNAVLIKREYGPLIRKDWR